MIFLTTIATDAVVKVEPAGVFCFREVYTFSQVVLLKLTRRNFASFALCQGGRLMRVLTLPRPVSFLTAIVADSEIQQESGDLVRFSEADSGTPSTCTLLYRSASGPKDYIFSCIISHSNSSKTTICTLCDRCDK